MTFSSAVMFWNRLKRWNTMPTSPGPGRRPSSATSPRLRLLEQARQRRSVDFPEPDGPMITFTCAGLDLERDAAQHLEVAVALVHVLGAEHRSSRIVRDRGTAGADGARAAAADVHVNLRSRRACSTISMLTIPR